MTALLNLLNRLAIMVQPKRLMREEFGEVIDQALEAKYIIEDFYNFGISDSGLKHRDVLRAGSRASTAAPLPASVTTPPPEPMPAEPTPAPVLERAEPIAPATTPRPTMKKLGETRNAILHAILASGDGLTAVQVATQLNLSASGVQAHLAKLLKSEQIIRSGTGKQFDGFRYCKPDSAARFPEDIQSSYATAKPVLKIAPTKRIEAVVETRAAPMVTDPFDTVLDDLELEIAAAQNVIAALRPLKREMRDRVVRMITGRFEAVS